MDVVKETWRRNQRFQTIFVSLASFCLGLMTFYVSMGTSYTTCAVSATHLCACAKQTVIAQQSKKEIRNKYESSTISDYVNLLVPHDESDATFECVEGRLGLTRFPVCLFNPLTDVHVSGWIKRHGGEMWEGENVISLLHALGAPAEETGFIDIGANIGAFTLSAAHRGHKVVAVEPMPGALRRLMKSVVLGGISDRVKVVQGGLSNETGLMYLAKGRFNKGATHLVPEKECYNGAFTTCNTDRPIPLFYMDDLLEVVTFKKAVMKIDCEGFEYRAFKKAVKLFKAVDISYVEIEWMHYRKKFQDTAEHKHDAEGLIKFFTSRDYSVYKTSGESLKDSSWTSWPNDIVFKR